MSQVKVSNRLPLRSYALKAIMAALVTTVINVIIFYIGKAAGAFPANIHVMADSPLQVSNVIMMSVIATVIGILVFAAVGSLKVFRIIAVIVFLLFIFTPFTVVDAPAAFIVTLEIMHIIAFIVTLWVASNTNSKKV